MRTPARVRTGLGLLAAGAMGFVALGCDSGSSGGRSQDARAKDDPGSPAADGSPDVAIGQISIGIGEGTNICPTVTVTAAPPSAPVGSSIDLRAWAADPDAFDAGATRPLTLTWTGPTGAGTLSDPTAAETRYACTQPGLQVVTIAVSDGRCTQTETVALHCLASDAGVADSAPGGAPGTGGGSPAGSGGNDGSGGHSSSGGAFGLGGAASSGGRSGSGGHAGSGGATGTGATGTGTTGTGGTAGTRATPASGGATGSGGGSVAGGGGAGLAGAGGGGGKSGVGGGSGGASPGTGGAAAADGSSGSPNPSTDEGEACNRCTEDNCNIATDGCAVIGFQNPSDAPLCESLYACLRSQHCTSDANNDMLPDQDSSQWCWCGLPPEAEATDCFTLPGTAKGPCLAEIVKAAHSSDPATIRLRFADPSYPLGRAANLANCRSAYCGSVCR